MSVCSPKALWDRGTLKRLREILFFLYYPKRTVSKCDVLSSSEMNCCFTLVISSFWECGTFSLVNMQFVSICRMWGQKDSQWKWAAVIAEVGALITVYMTAVLSQNTLEFSQAQLCVCVWDRERPPFLRTSTCNTPQHGTTSLHVWHLEWRRRYWRCNTGKKPFIWVSYTRGITFELRKNALFSSLWRCVIQL